MRENKLPIRIVSFVLMAALLLQSVPLAAAPAFAEEAASQPEATVQPTEQPTPEPDVTPAPSVEPTEAPTPSAEPTPAAEISGEEFLARVAALQAKLEAGNLDNDFAAELYALWPLFYADTEGAEDDLPLTDFANGLTEDERSAAAATLLAAQAALAAATVMPYENEVLRYENITVVGAPAMRGSGSAHLNVVDNDYRFYAEYMVDPTAVVADIKRRSEIQVYLKAGDYAYFGSSIANSQLNVAHAKTSTTAQQCDIVVECEEPGSIWKQGDTAVSNGTAVAFDVVSNGAGYIANYKKERGGPELPGADNSASAEYEYYTPLSFRAMKDGTYTFHFHSVTGERNVGSAPKKVTEAFDQGKGTVAAWDVTVVGKDSDGKYRVKSGRAWANYLALTSCGTRSGNTAYKATLDVNVLTHDGIVYNAKLKDITPFGFLFFANNMGFTTVGDTHYSIYHSFYDNDNDLLNIEKEEKVTVHKPSDPDTTLEQTYKIFFNQPADETKNYLRMNNTDGDPSINDVRFYGVKGGIAEYGHGGVFTFTAHNASTVTLEINFRDMMASIKSSLPGKIETQQERVKEAATGDEKVAEQEQSKLDELIATQALWDSYKGTGIISLSGAVVDGKNSFSWDGTDTSGQMVPPGDYNQNATRIEVHYQAKAGEIHFPMTDVEGMYGGVEIKRLNGSTTEAENAPARYHIYYNNSPLAYNSIEGQGVTSSTVRQVAKTKNGTNETRTYNVLSDETYSLVSKEVNGNGSGRFFENGKDGNSEVVIGPENISTYQKVRDAEGSMAAVYEPKPVDSRYTTMRFLANDTNNGGGGNQAGIDVWTYYEKGNGTVKLGTDFSVVKTSNVGTISGKVFYDNPDNNAGLGIFNESDHGDRPLEGVTVRLMKKVTENDTVKYEPFLHRVYLPLFNEEGYHVIDPATGEVAVEEQIVEFEAVTQRDGSYKFTGVPYEDDAAGTTYWVQVLLDKSHTDILHYVCSTKLSTAVDSNDGNGLVITTDTTDAKKTIKTIQRDNNGEVVFDVTRAQSVTLKKNNVNATVAAIGYTSQVIAGNLKDYTFKKMWATDPPVPDITVELWCWDPTVVPDANNEYGYGKNGRSGILVDTVRLSSRDAETVNSNTWSITWKNLDKSLPYFFIEYYDKFDENGQLMHYDNGEQRRVVMGATMPLFDTLQDATDPTYEVGSGQQQKYATATDSADIAYYRFQHDHSVTSRTETYDGHPADQVPVQYFGEGNNNTHPDATWQEEKVTNIDTNAMLFNMTYTLSSDKNTNIVTVTNTQSYSESNYYVWLGHKTELPNFISTKKRVVDADNHYQVVTTAKELEVCAHADGVKHAKGVTITSLDKTTIQRGDSTNHFIYDNENHTSIWFIPDKSIVNKGIGIRTYNVEYTVDAHNSPVHVTVVTAADVGANGNTLQLADVGELAYVDADDGNKLKLVSTNSAYKTYSWTMSIHVYDTRSDGVIEYSPAETVEPVVIQAAMQENEKLEWHPGTDGICHVVNDFRDPYHSLVVNDTLRVPMYQSATLHTMGTCADITGLALISVSNENSAKVDQLIAALDFTANMGTNWEGENAAAKSNEQIVNLLKEIKSDFAFTEINKANATYSTAIDDTSTGTGEAGNTGRKYASWVVPGEYGQLDVAMTVRCDSQGNISKLSRGQDHANYLNITYMPKKSTSTPATQYLIYRIGVLGEDTTAANSGELAADRGAVMYSYVKLVPDTEGTKFVGATLNVGENFSINFYMAGIQQRVYNSSKEQIPGGSDQEDYVDISKYYVVFDDGSGEPVRVDYDKVNGLELKNQTIPVTNQNGTTENVTRNFYGFTYANKLVAYQMTQPITAKLYHKGNDEGHDILLDERTYSIRQYAENIYKKYPTKAAAEDVNMGKLWAMLIDMVNFGASSHVYAEEMEWVSKAKGKISEADESANLANGYLPSDLRNRHQNPSSSSDGDVLVKNEVSGGAEVIDCRLVLEQGMKLSMVTRFRLPANSPKEKWDVKVTSDLKEFFVQGGDFEKRDGNIYYLKKENVELQSDGSYTLIISSITPFFWNTNITLEFIPQNNQSDSHTTLTCSVQRWCNSAVNGTITDAIATPEPVHIPGATPTTAPTVPPAGSSYWVSLRNLARAMRLYGNTAEAWRLNESTWNATSTAAPSATPSATPDAP